jgi:DNA polymerase bacteriophage-type
MHTSSVLHLDFETQSAADLTAVGSHLYAKHPSTKLLCMGFAFDDEEVQLWTPNKLIPNEVFYYVKNGGKVVAHNLSGFEFLLWNTIGVFTHGWPPLKLEQCEDTLALCYAMALPGKLEHAAPASGVTFQKDMKGHKVMMKLCKPKKDGTMWTPETAPEDFETLYKYCKQDVVVEREMHKRLMPLSPRETELWRLDHKINQRGVFIDIKSVRAAIKVIDYETKRLDDEMNRVTLGAVEFCTNAKALSTWIKYRGIETPGVAKGDVVDLLYRDDIPNDVRQALLLRQEAAKSSTAKLETMIGCVSSDGRIKGCFQYHGASTGRFAGRRVQLHNLPRPKIKQKEIDQIFELLGAVE